MTLLEFQGFLQTGYWWVLGALTLGVTVKGTLPMLRTALSLLMVGFCSLYANAYLAEFGTSEYAVAMMAADGIFAAIILIRPAGKVQSLIGWTFLIQIMVHGGMLAARLFSYPTDMDSYWWGLTIGALLQLALIGGWWGHDRVRGRGTLHRPDPVSAPSYRASLGP